VLLLLFQLHWPWFTGAHCNTEILLTLLRRARTPVAL
jgi:hypothetical protein